MCHVDSRGRSTSFGPLNAVHAHSGVVVTMVHLWVLDGYQVLHVAVPVAEASSRVGTEPRLVWGRW